VPRELRGLNCAAFVAGIVAGILDAAEFVRVWHRATPLSLTHIYTQPAEVSAHFREKEGTPFAANVIVIRFAPAVIEREAKLTT
jgi:hypothetical protein